MTEDSVNQYESSQEAGSHRRPSAQKKRLGIFCLPGRGHLYPAIALGRHLKSNGYQVTVFNRNIARSIVTASGLDFGLIEDEYPPCAHYPGLASSIQCPQRLIGPPTLDTIYRHCLLVLRQAHRLLQSLDIETLLVDQADLATGSVAELLQIPFATVSFFPPVFLDDESPPFIYQWSPGSGAFEQRRNKRGNALLRRLVAPILDIVNAQRKVWDLPRIVDLNDVFSRQAVITQMPKALDFPRARQPANLFHTGLFYDGKGRPVLDFPWYRLNGKPLIYACMGTVRNGLRWVFETIAAACAGFDAQLVISLGGMALTPEDFGTLPGNPIVVHYAPQMQILERACLTICHGGMNTTLESIHNGVPLIAIPITDDQPGVAARIEWKGVGVALPFRKLTVTRLQQRVNLLLTSAEYRSAVIDLQAECGNFSGLDQALDVLRRNLSIG